MPIIDAKPIRRLDNSPSTMEKVENNDNMNTRCLPVESDNTDVGNEYKPVTENKSGVLSSNADAGTHCAKSDEIPLDGRSDSEPSDVDQDKEEILAALQSIHDSTVSNPEEVPENASAISEVFGADEGGDSCDELVTPIAELGLATNTMTELNFTWDSTINTSALGTLDTHCSAPDNQFFQGTSSDLELDNRMEHANSDDMAFANPVTGVTFDSRMNVYKEPLKKGKDPEEGEDDFSDVDIKFSKNASRLALESREAMFRRAMSLLSARCTSVKQEQTENGLPFGIQSPKYFYVTQDKPLPMEPLKAWRGYNGNVYFEPIQINHLKVDEAELLRAKTSIPRTRQKLTAKLDSQQQQRLPITDKENKTDSRTESRQTNKSTQSNASTSRQMAVLDRQVVANRLNDNIHEDMIWIEGQENTGSLAIRPRSHPDKRARDRDLQYNKERIKKGSVVHKLYEEKKAKQRPKLTVSGGKFTPPTSMSPLLRTQTQYSLSHRLTTNSPDPYHGDAKLPPLDHLRASLKHMNNKPAPVAKGYSRSVTLTDDMKPFIKYSPDVVAKYAQQAAL